LPLLLKPLAAGFCGLGTTLVVAHAALVNQASALVAAWR
jgi:hypothetical protein